MYNQHQKQIQREMTKQIFFRRSCLTNKIVWICHAPTKGAARLAYWRACKRELERVKHWSNTVARRCANIARFRSDCTAEIPITAEFTPEQVSAARQLQSIEKHESEYHSDFYDHIIEERRQREETRELRRRTRELGYV